MTNPSSPAAPNGQRSARRETPLSRGAIAWAIFEGGRNPFVILVTIYVFMPYVASVLVGDPVRGQEVISRWAQYAGWTVLVTAPLLGAAVDKLGPRKGWLSLIVGIMGPATICLWFAKPDGTGLSLTATMLLATVGSICFTYSEVLHNALLVRAAGLPAAHRASGLGLALGSLSSVILLAFTAWAFALPGKVAWSWVPAAPLFGLDPAAHEPERVVAVLAGAALLVGSAPLFLFTPDAPRTGRGLWSAFVGGAGELWAMVRTVRGQRDAVIFLVSRMLFVDGMNAILVYLGVYAVGVMGWDALSMLTFGVLLSVFSVGGGLLGRALDAHLGPKTALTVAIGMTFLGVVALLGVAPHHILYIWEVDPGERLWNGPVFRSAADGAFLLVGFVIAVFVTAQYASSRTMLTRLTPPEQSGAYFGVYSLSGVATAWLGPLLVNVGTRATHSQQGGFATILLLLVAGLVGLSRVRGGGRSAPSPE